MTQNDGEKKVKSIQKELLIIMERDPVIENLDPMLFNSVRRSVFRCTFLAFKLGVIGLEKAPPKLFSKFFGSIDEQLLIDDYAPELKSELMEKVFVAALEAFRVGSFVKWSSSDEIYTR